MSEMKNKKPYCFGTCILDCFKDCSFYNKCFEEMKKRLSKQQTKDVKLTNKNNSKRG